VALVHGLHQLVDGVQVGQVACDGIRGTAGGGDARGDFVQQVTETP
jgi:hypothetical protein